MMAGTTAAPPEDLIIRDTTEPDMQAIQRIYAFYVLNGLATFEDIAPSVDDMINRRATVVAARLPLAAAKIPHPLRCMLDWASARWVPLRRLASSSANGSTPS
jgi:L-amino acid N-acyltransferase YncA